ncbi:protein mono-ADP-ribosyltransferase PARP4 isoform X2 [Xiphias gladius]|uniref:protein mono-ADP-ribosyltransferase PARP4 isoform X2 n=1 Tax=Xiphias gladius TaxID=8245 RepID=UPI001A9A1FCB|nr:protein mono-ADP-ribosyltransferase PARP4 isoform X2 [Xiphias gladius]
MAVFENCSVLLELKNLPFKEKKRVKSAVTENGGDISFVVNKQCSLIVTSDASNLSSNRLRSIQRCRTPVVGVEYVYSCLDRGLLLPVDEYKLDPSSPSAFSPPPLPPSSPRPESEGAASAAAAELPRGPAKPVDAVGLTQKAEAPVGSGRVLEKFRVYTETDSDLPSYPENFQVAKYSVFEKINSNTWCVLELQSVKGESGRRYRVVKYWKNDMGATKGAVKDTLVFLSTSEEALEVYQALRETLRAAGLQPRSNIPPQAWDLGSTALQQLLLEERLNAGSLSQEVGVFVELLWTEALGYLGNVLGVSIDKLSLNDVSRAEGLLLQAQRKLREANHTEVASLLAEVLTLLPHRVPHLPPNAKLISQKLDLCQLIRDVLNVSETTLRSPAPSCLGKYRALRCSIETVPRTSSEFRAATALLRKREVQIQQVLRVSRGVELQTFRSELGNIRPLLHSSSPSNFVGILSRGLLLPRVGVEHHGIERTDIGNLGGGIYFSDAVSASLKYSKPSVTDGSRLLLVCDVALGSCRDVHRRDLALTEAPEGHHSVHGVRRTPNTPSEFEDDEYVVYSPDQVKLKYVVQFSIEGDQLKEFSPAVNASAEPCLPSADQELGLEDDGVESIKDPLEDVTAGLLDSSGQQLPLQAVHVKCRLMDLLSQVIIFQKYTNVSSVPIEAKYVFPLDDSAAVCGFEAFIDGKRVVGKVKEKEKARKEYKQAIERGHGAYLMDQDAPDVFTISVGNLPPGATVLIKVTFVSELMVRDGGILFSLPGSVAPWQESAALNQTTQVTVAKVCVTDEAASRREFTLDMSIEMPYEITSLRCITHKVKIKRTDCKAVVSVLPGEVMGADGFELSVTLSEVHLPRMWVEKHPDKDSQACMLVFYPDFDLDSGSASDEVVLLLDTSESMRGESLHMAQRIALQVLKALGQNLRVNVILFGTDHTEAFLTAQPLVEARQTAESFIKHFSPVGGSTELWRPLRALSLLPPSRGIRNLLLLSDGHIQNAELTLQLLRDNAQHSRLFTCGLSPTANRHMLRALAQAGGGAYEFFDTKIKHTWGKKVACQVKRIASPGCSSVSVKWRQFNPTAPPPVQAPKQLHALFNDCHTLVYGFVPHCTQATLLGNLSGKELKTMVSTSELQKSRGTFLHKLTARALIRDYEDGSLDTNEAEHEGKKAELKSFIIELSKEFSILSQFTSFVAIEERDAEQPEKGFTDIPKLIAEEDVDFLPYISWIFPQDSEEEKENADEEGGCFEEEEKNFVDLSESYFMEEDYNDIEGNLCCILQGSISPDYSPMRASRASVASPLKFHTDSQAVIGAPQAKKEGWFMRSAKEKHDEMEYLSAVEIHDLADTVQGKVSHTPSPPPRPHPMCFSKLVQTQFSDSPISPPTPPPPPAFIHSQSPKFDPPHPLLPRCPASYLEPMSHPVVHGRPSLLTQTVETDKGFGKTEQVSKSLQASRGPMSASRNLFSLPIISTQLQRAALADRSAVSLSKGLDLDMCLGSEDISFDPMGCMSYPAGPASAPECSAKSVWSLTNEASPNSVTPAHTTDFKSFSLRRSKRSFEVEQALGFGFSGSEVRQELFGTSGPPLPQVQPQEEIFSFGVCRGRGDVQPRRFSFREELDQSEPAPVESVPQPVLRKRLQLRSGLRRTTSETAQGFTQKVGEHLFLQSLPVHHSFERKSRDPEVLELKWTKIFQMQHSEGYWELTTELGELISVNVDVFANVFLKNKGIRSLGVRAHADILRMVATLLVLQLMRVEKLEEGKLLRTLFCLDNSSQPRPGRWEEVKRAVEWVCWADHQYPCVYSRLEFGSSWDSSTRQLLGHEGLPPFSPLSGLNLQRTAAPLPIH